MPEAASVSLRHVTFITDGITYLPFAGQTRVTKGVIEVSLAEPADVLGAWYDGYRLDAETGEEILPGQLDAYISAKTPVAEVDPVYGPNLSDLTD